MFKINCNGSQVIVYGPHHAAIHTTRALVLVSCAHGLEALGLLSCFIHCASILTGRITGLARPSLRPSVLLSRPVLYVLLT